MLFQTINLRKAVLFGRWISAEHVQSLPFILKSVCVINPL